MQYGINIVPDKNVTGNVTIYLQDVPFEAGLAILLESNGFEHENKDGMYLVHAKGDNNIGFEVQFQDGNLTIDARSADIRQLLREITTKAGLNIVYGGDLMGNVSAHFVDMPPEDALYNLLAANEFSVDQENGVYFVRPSRIQQQMKGAGNFSVSHRNGKLSIDAKNASAVDLLYEIASQCKINLINVGTFQGNVTIRLDGVTLEQALDAVSDAASITYMVTGDIYVVGEAMVRPGQSNPLLEQKVIWLKYIEASELMNSLPKDIPAANVSISQDRNVLIVVATKEVIQRIESLVEEVDIEDPQIRSRQQSAIFVEVDDQGLLTIDAKDASMEMLLREISIKKDIDVTILSGDGVEEGGQIISRSSIRRPQQEGQIPQQPLAQTSTPTSTARTQTIPYQAGGTSRGFGRLVNFRIRNASLDDTFDALFEGTKYAYKKVEGDRDLYIIGTGELSLGISNPLLISKKISFQYLNALEVVNILPLSIPDENIIVIGDQNAIVIVGTQAMINEVESYISQIDSPTPQIMIEAFLVEVTRGESRDLGINWSWADKSEKNFITVSPGLSVAFDSLIGVPKNFLATLNAMISENRAKVLAKPRVATTNGLKATINVGRTDYFETTTEIYQGENLLAGGYSRRDFSSLDSGITLDITPWVGAAEEITVLIHPEVRDAKQISREHSTIATRMLDTTVRVKDGETIVIGGLIQRNENYQEAGVPMLGRIPVLGRLFRNNQKINTDTELIIIVRPKIISGNDS